MPEIIPLVSITLDKERHLKLTLGGMKCFAQATGKSLLKGFSFNDMTEGELIAFIWACLIWEDKKLTCEDVGYLLDISKLAEVTEKLRLAVSVSTPEPDGTPLAGKPLNGKTSGQSASTVSNLPQTSSGT
jgi:hypothetical protein